MNPFMKIFVITDSDNARTNKIDRKTRYFISRKPHKSQPRHLKNVSSTIKTITIVNRKNQEDPLIPYSSPSHFPGSSPKTLLVNLPSSRGYFSKSSPSISQSRRLNVFQTSSLDRSSKLSLLGQPIHHTSEQEM